MSQHFSIVQRLGSPPSWTAWTSEPSSRSVGPRRPRSQEVIMPGSSRIPGRCGNQWTYWHSAGAGVVLQNSGEDSEPKPRRPRSGSAVARRRLLEYWRRSQCPALRQIPVAWQGRQEAIPGIRKTRPLVAPTKSAGRPLEIGGNGSPPLGGVCGTSTRIVSRCLVTRDKSGSRR